MNKIAVENVVFCENVRPEMHGKHTLLGVSAPELNLSQIPGVISVAIWISGTPSGMGPFEADFRALDVDKNAIVSANMKGDIGGVGKISIVIGPMPLPINKAGDYIFEWNFDGKKWDKIGTLRINYMAPVVAVTPAPTA